MKPIGFYLAIAVLSSIVGRASAQDEGKVVIRSMGPAEQSDGTRGYPHVDSGGRINLFRFGPDFHSHFGQLAHEMVHVFRSHRRSSWAVGRQR